MRRRTPFALLTALVVVGIAAFATAPPGLVNEAIAPDINGDLDAWLAASERAAALSAELIPDTEKRIHWFNGSQGSKTRHSVVYLHGFSATRQEIAPVAEWVAEQLGANLFETRLRGHGQVSNPLAGVRAEDWLEDAAEALAIGAAIGEDIILMGTSTGATLALAMAGHPSFARVGYLVLMSPNFAPSDPSAEFLTWPGGPQLAYMVAGDTRSWTPRNDLQARYWSTTYPMDAVIEMMRLVKYVRAQLPMRLQQPLLVIYSPADQVVDTARITQAYEQINSPRSQLIEIPDSGDPSDHVLAGSIMSPATTADVAGGIVEFVSNQDRDLEPQ
jgi:esterase/lipase